MQRVRIGLTGLGSVFLLVLAAAAFFGLARREPDARRDGSPVIAGAGNLANAEAPKEPLAELGVTPGNVPDKPAPTHRDTPSAPARR